MLAATVLAGSCCAALVAEPEPRKLAVPDAAAREKAEKLVQEVFQEDLARAKGNPAALRKLGGTLVEQARETKDDPAARFVLFRDAAELAAQAGDLADATHRITEIAREFAVDKAELQLHVLETAAPSAADADANLKLAEAALATFSDALAADNFDVAGRLVAVAETAARKAKNLPLLARAEARSKEIHEIARAYEPVRAAVETLRQKPDDAEANLAVGKFCCFVRDNWDKGLPLIAKAGESKLQQLAVKDVARPTEPRDQVALADGWWELAETERDQARTALQQRASYWYEQAVPHLAGLTKAKVEKRLKSLMANSSNLATAEVRRWEAPFVYVGNVAVTPDGKRALATGTSKKEGERGSRGGECVGLVMEWDLKNGKELKRTALDGLRGQPAFVNNGRRALSGADDHSVRLWDLDSAQELRRFATPSAILHIAWSPNGRHAFLSGGFKTPFVYLWDLAADREVKRLDTHEMNVERVAFTADGRQAFAAGKFGDLALHLWNVETGEELRRFVGHTDTPQGVGFSSDGKRLLSGGEDKTLRLWDAETGQVVRVLQGHTTPIWCVAFSPDGKRALSGGGYMKYKGGRPEYKDDKPVFEDCVVRLWDLETGHEICRFEGHEAQVNSVAFSHDGEYAISGSADKTVRLWRLPR
jgi:hypothetical protein